MNHKKVIFLDIEGVVVTHRSFLWAHSPTAHYHGARQPGWHAFIDKYAMGLVYRLAQDYEAVIVLTSTLRDDKYVMEGLMAIAPPRIESPADYLVDVTGHSTSREKEIRDYIEDNGVEKYVVFDDRQLQIENFIQINPYDGISIQDFNDAKLMLVNEGDKPTYEGIFL